MPGYLATGRSTRLAPRFM
ncbi:hypothetical protein F383_03790 [Gossypium arboreum]|uniref:Uncharacterized protein n=1 Tax=Gossypium arboreum TaxID=29729 RepID=A0A0B0PDG8_GOSAR|nr:hypothetical protein F383_03790 [Gossypium arboreum]